MAICEKCSKGFQNKQSLEQHYNAKHTAVSEPARPEKSRKKLYIAAVAAIIISSWMILDGEDEKRIVDESEIPRGPTHRHPQLRVYINGEQQMIPANLGIRGTYTAPVHTHDTTGLLHYETTSPSEKTSTLGYFVNDVWKEKFSRECLMDFCNGPGGNVTMTVNGEPEPKFDRYMPKDGDGIVIAFGAPTAEQIRNSALDIQPAARHE